MPRLISQPTRIASAGNKPKLIDEFIGRVNSATEALSVAHMRSPGGWVEPGQTPDFDEYTVVLAGMLRVESKGGVLEVRPGQAVQTIFCPARCITDQLDKLRRVLVYGSNVEADYAAGGDG